MRWQHLKTVWALWSVRAVRTLWNKTPAYHHRIGATTLRDSGGDAGSVTPPVYRHDRGDPASFFISHGQHLAWARPC